MWANELTWRIRTLGWILLRGGQMAVGEKSWLGIVAPRTVERWICIVCLHGRE